MSDLSSVLAKIGLEENELRVYEVVVAFSFRTKGQISSYTGLSINEVEETCESLISKHFLKVKKSKSPESDVFIPLAPKISISSQVSKNLSTKLEDLSQKISELWNNAQGSIDQDVEALINTVQTSLSKLSDVLSDYSADHLEVLNSSGELYQEEISNVTVEAIAKLQEQINTPLRNTALKIKEVTEQIVSIAETSVRNINEANNSHEELIKTSAQEVKEKLEFFVDSVGLFSAGRVSGVLQQIQSTSDEKSNEVETLINQMKKKADNFITNDFSELKQIDASFTNAILDQYNLENKKLYKSINEYQTQISANINSINDVQNNSIKSTIDSSEKIITEITNLLKTNVTKLEGELSTAIKTVQKEAVNYLGGVLKNTSTQLGTLNIDMIKALKDNEKKLNEDLSQLNESLTTSLNARFNDIETQLGGFVNNLKSSSSQNVEEIVSSVTGLKDFLLAFLSDTDTELNTHLTQLQTDVKNRLSKIVSEHNKELKESVKQNNDNLTQSNEEISNRLDEFQTEVNQFLKNTKEHLEEKLSVAKTEFRKGVDEGVEAYQTEFKKRQEEQTEQIHAIQDETKTLIERSDHAIKEIKDYLASTLNQNQDRFITSTSENVNGSIEQFSREFTRFNERMEKELKEFYENFHEQSTGLRDDVPQGIEDVFVDQIDRMENFRRDFQRVMSHANDTLNNFLNAFSSDGKKIDKKKVQELYGDVNRAISDFRSFDDRLNNHFNKSIEETEDTKDNLLNQVNKTIQDGLSNLEKLIEKQNIDGTKLTKNFMSDLSSNTNDLLHGLSTGVKEPIETLKETISEQLLTIFQQPLTDLLIKARSLATGTEGAEQENRLLVTQKLLVAKIQEAVEALISGLDNVFTSSISELDERVENSIKESDTILNSLHEEIETMINTQKNNVGNFSENLSGSLTNVQHMINDNLKESLHQMKSQIKETTGLKSSEVTETVENKTNLLTESTQSVLKQVDVELSSFNKEFKNILSETLGGVKTTVDTATQSQKASLDGTIKNLQSTTNKSQTAIDKTQKSLSEKVSKPLTMIEKEVSAQTTNFDKTLVKSKNTLNKDIKKYYSSSDKFLKQLAEINKVVAKLSGNYQNEVNQVATNIEKSLTTNVKNLQTERKQRTSAFKDEIYQAVDEISDINISHITDVFDQVNSQLSMLQVEINENIDTSKDGIDLLVTNSFEQIRTEVLNAAQPVVKIIDDEKKSSVIAFNNVIEVIEGIDGSQGNTITDAKDQLIKSLQSQVESKGGEWSKKVEKIYSKQLNNVSSLSDNFKESIIQHSSKGKKNVDEQIDKIPLTIEETLDAAAKSMSLLNEISKGAISLEAKFPELSYFDVSKEAILANLNAVISRTKSNLTIVAPTISWLNEDLIEKFTRVSVKIITDTTQHTAEDTRIISIFTDKGVNLDLRRLDRNRFRGNIDMIMATRDKEEVILAKLPDSKDAYALVSQDEVFIEKFTELFAPFQTMPRLT